MTTCVLDAAPAAPATELLDGALDGVPATEAETAATPEVAPTAGTPEVAGAADLAGAPEAAAPAPAGLPFEARLAKLEATVTRHPLHREILYRTLGFCQQARSLAEIEDQIASYPEFGRAVQDQYHLICALEAAGGLTRTPLDAQGEPVTPEQLEGLTEDEADDLVATYAFATTDVGAALVEQHAPRARLVELMGIVPEREETFLELMAFIEEKPRTYREICDLLKGRPALIREIDGGRTQVMQPSVFLDKLEAAGGVEWNDGWVLTDEGRDFLDEAVRS